MSNSDCFEQFLGFGNIAEALAFNYRELDGMGLDAAPLLRLGLLVETRIGSSVECAGCGVSVPVSPRTQDDGIKLLADCPECGVYQLSPLESKLWKVNFIPLFEAARKSLRCSGKLTELIPNALWSLGRSALAGQSREVFISAGINTMRNNKILAKLPEGKTPLLLILGDAPYPEKLGAFSSDRVFLISDIVSFEDEKISFDVSAIQVQLGMLPALEEPTPKAIGKNSKIGDLIIKLKDELRQYMRGVYSAMDQAERSGNDYKFVGIKQNELAAAIGSTPVAVTRAMKKDMELKALFDAANNPRTAFTYGRKTRG